MSVEWITFIDLIFSKLIIKGYSQRIVGKLYDSVPLAFELFGVKSHLFFGIYHPFYVYVGSKQNQSG